MSDFRYLELGNAHQVMCVILTVGVTDTGSIWHSSTEKLKGHPNLNWRVSFILR